MLYVLSVPLSHNGLPVQVTAVFPNPIVCWVKCCQVAGSFFGFQNSCSVVEFVPEVMSSLPDVLIFGGIAFGMAVCKSSAQLLNA